MSVKKSLQNKREKKFNDLTTNWERAYPRVCEGVDWNENESLRATVNVQHV